MTLMEIVTGMGGTHHLEMTGRSMETVESLLLVCAGAEVSEIDGIPRYQIYRGVDGGNEAGRKKSLTNCGEDQSGLRYDESAGNHWRIDLLFVARILNLCERTSKLRERGREFADGLPGVGKLVE